MQIGYITWRQNFFARLGVEKLICESLKVKTFSLKTKIRIFKFAISLLYGGNLKVQKNFLTYFREDDGQNQVEIFEVLIELLTRNFNLIKKRMKKMNKENLKLYYSEFYYKKAKHISSENLKLRIDNF